MIDTQTIDRTQQPSPETNNELKLDQSWLEPRLVVVTLVALLLGLLGERWGWPAHLLAAFGVIAYAAGGFYGLKAGITSLRHRHVDVDLLMVLAALGAAIIGEWHEGAILLFLFSLSNVLQDYAIGRSRQAIRGLLKLYPNEARVRREGRIVQIEVKQIRIGEVVVIQPGERIPVDGIIRAGYSTIDQSPITGESMPVEKREGDRVFAGTLNQQGTLDVEAASQAADTMLSRIIKMVEEAQDSKAPTERFLDVFEQRYALFIIVAVLLFIVVPPALGLIDFHTNFYRAMVLMTVASPCALVISTPASFISAIASAARGGVLFKGGAYLEGLASIKAIAFDKTGTLTLGRPALTAVQPVGGISDDELLRILAAAEQRSEHPLARAIVEAARARNIPMDEVTDFQALPGRGIEATLDGKRLLIGSAGYMTDGNPLPPEMQATRDQLEAQGNTVMVATYDGQWIGLVALADSVRPEAKDMIERLHERGIKVAMLTGDNERVARNIARQLGVDDVYAELMPDDKVTVVQEIQQKVGPVAMVGDGVNDAPALATADIGIAMGAAGTDVALETADLVLMGDRLQLIDYAISLSRKARRVVWQNISFSIAVIVLLILGAFFINLPLPLGVLGHEGSTVIVVLNGLLSLLIIPEIHRRRQAKAGA
jgi:Cd2+/Zn2+-exporting ATPase